MSSNLESEGKHFMRLASGTDAESCWSSAGPVELFIDFVKRTINLCTGEEPQ